MTIDFEKTTGSAVPIMDGQGYSAEVTYYHPPSSEVVVLLRKLLPVVPAHLNPNQAAERSADALAGAFYDLQIWFNKQSCGKAMAGVLAIKMDEFIKKNFKEIGGQATRNAPLGWTGKAKQYIEDWTGTDSCY